MKYSKLNKLFILVLSICVVYKSVLVALHIDVIVYISTFFLIGINLFRLLTMFKIERNMQWVLPFLSVGVMALLISTLKGMAFIGSIGFAGIYLYLIFWGLCLSLPSVTKRNELFMYYVHIQLILAAGTAVFAVYQYYVDPTLFGVNPHKLYSDVALLDSGKITRRATSFIGSPQNLGLYLGVMFGLVWLSPFTKAVKLYISGLFFWGGLLSGSSAFFAVVVFFLLGYYSRNIKNYSSLLLRLSACFVFIAIIVILQRISIDEAAYNAVRFDLKTHLPYLTRFIEQDTLTNYFFGRGIGISDRLVEVLSGKNIPEVWVPGIESYLEKIYFELGIIGLFSFAALYSIAMYKAFKSTGKPGRVIFAILLGVLSNLAATPSFAGLTMSFILWPFILYPVVALKKTPTSRHQLCFLNKVWNGKRLAALEDSKSAKRSPAIGE